MKFAAALTTLAASAALVAAHPGHAHVAKRHGSAAHAHALSGRDVSPPAGWLTDVLENYTTYHIRYLAIDCEAKHNTSFFADCCHPLLAMQSLQADRKPECIPTTAESASAASEVMTASPLTGAAIDPIATSSAIVNVAPPPVISSSSSAAPPPPPTSSAAPPPPPPSSTYVPPPPSSTYSAPPPPATTSASSSSGGSGSGGLAGIVGELFSGGVATYFWQNGVAGACGTVHQDTDYIVALQTQTYANGAHCGKQIILQDIDTGKTLTATVADECPTCDNAMSIDLSNGLFTAFATEAQGQFSVQWGFSSE